MVNPAFAAGVGNPKTLSLRFTTGVVAKAIRSSGENWHSTPSVRNSCSTSVGVKEIVSDMADNGMVACEKVGFSGPTDRDGILNHVITC